MVSLWRQSQRHDNTIEKNESFLKKPKAFSTKSLRFGHSHFGLVTEIPEKVLYRSSGSDFTFPDEISDGEKEYPYKHLNKFTLFTKSNEWIYEKEYRSTLELITSDIISYNSELDITFKNDLESYANNCGIPIEKTPNGTTFINIPIEFDNEKPNTERSELFFRSRPLSQNHFFLLSEESISGIIFGCRVSDHQIENLKLEANKNGNFGHLKFYKSIIDRSSAYRLSIEEV